MRLSERDRGHMSMFLTTEELAELTEATTRSKQIEWLARRGWVFEISRLGNPKVLRGYAASKMGLATEAPAGQTEPDFSHWRY
jgi:hypothetical protein